MTPGIDDRNVKDDPTQRVDSRLLAVLVCPVTKGPLEYDAQNNELISQQLGVAFPIRGGVPIKLVDEARDLNAKGSHSDG
mgnify:FL=1